MVITVLLPNSVYCTPATPLLITMIMMMVKECHVQCWRLFSQELMEL